MEYKSIYEDDSNPAFEKVLNAIEGLYQEIEKISAEIQQLDPTALDDLTEPANSDEDEEFAPDFSNLEPTEPSSVDDTADVPGDPGELTVGDELVPVIEEDSDDDEEDDMADSAGEE